MQRTRKQPVRGHWAENPRGRREERTGVPAFGSKKIPVSLLTISSLFYLKDLWSGGGVGNIITMALTEALVTRQSP